MRDKRLAALGGILLLVALYGWLNPLRLTHWALLTLLATLCLANRTTRGLAVAVWPAAIFGFAYDLMRLLLARDYSMQPSANVHALEVALFGWMSPADGALGPVDFFHAHHWLVLDFAAAAWYSTHVPSVILVGLYIWWRTHRQHEPSRARLDKYFWGFLLFNLAGMLVWAIWPVAPPWWVQAHGFAAPQTLALPGGLVGSPAGLARIDAWLGYPYFASIYEQSTYVFGAMPSLHAAAPIWVALWTRRRALRTLLWGYALAMSFFAVYLNHHYVVDVLAGAALAVSCYAMLEHTPVGAGFVHLNAWLRSELDALARLLGRAPATPPAQATLFGTERPAADTPNPERQKP